MTKVEELRRVQNVPKKKPANQQGLCRLLSINLLIHLSSGFKDVLLLTQTEQLDQDTSLGPLSHLSSFALQPAHRIMNSGQ